MELKGKVAIVTGASSGIGSATARRLASEGSYVVLTSRNEEKLQKVASEIKAQGGQALAVPADLRYEKHIDRVFEETVQVFGHLDILVNNAGVGIYGPVESGNPEDWRRMIDLNLFGLMYATQCAIRLMKPQRGGHIVNISSLAGRIGLPGWAVYSATKWGVIGFSESVRREILQYNIRITVIEPGAVATNWGENMPKKWVERRKRSNPLQPKDIAEAIVYVLRQPDHVSVNELLIRPTLQEL